MAGLGTSTSPSTAPTLKETELAAGASKVQLQYLDVLDPKDIETAFRTAAKGRADAVLLLRNPVSGTHRTQTLKLALKGRLPVIYNRSEFVEDGGLMSYGPSITDMWQRAAVYVDKILKGAKPADLPLNSRQNLSWSSISKPQSRSA